MPSAPRLAIVYSVFGMCGPPSQPGIPLQARRTDLDGEPPVMTAEVTATRSVAREREAEVLRAFVHPTRLATMGEMSLPRSASATSPTCWLDPSPTSRSSSPSLGRLGLLSTGLRGRAPTTASSTGESLGCWRLSPRSVAGGRPALAAAWLVAPVHAALMPDGVPCPVSGRAARPVRPDLSSAENDTWVTAAAGATDATRCCNYCPRGATWRSDE